MNKCKGIFGWMFGHKYKHCFDSFEELPNGTINLNPFWESSNTVIESFKMTKHIYKGHVCQRCGNLVNQQSQ